MGYGSNVDGVVRFDIEGEYGGTNRWITVQYKDGSSCNIWAYFEGIYLTSEKYFGTCIEYVNKDGLEYFKIPSTVDKKETYAKLYTEQFQGESIEIENFGTLKYAGIQPVEFSLPGLGTDIHVAYVYTNTLDNLKEGVTPVVYAKNGGKFKLEGYQLSDEGEEPEVSGDVGTVSCMFTGVSIVASAKRYELCIWEHRCNRNSYNRCVV